MTNFILALLAFALAIYIIAAKEGGMMTTEKTLEIVACYALAITPFALWQICDIIKWILTTQIEITFR